MKNNEKLSHYVRIIDQLIEQSLRSTKRELQNVQSYMYIFEKRVDNIILDLKKRSFQLQQDVSDGEDGAKKEAQAEQEKAVEKEQESEDEDASYGEEDEEDADGEDGY